MANKLKDTTPRPRIGKTAKDTRVARLIDINKIVDELNTELAAKDAEILNLQNQIDNLPASPAAPTTTVVNISSAQILAMGTTPIELLPDLVGNEMYRYSVLLYQNNSSVTEVAAFGVSTGLWVGDSAKQRGARVTATLITEPFVKGLDIPSDYQHTNNYLNDQFFGDKKVVLTSYNGSNPNQNIFADVTLKAVIKWEIISLI